MYSKKRRIERDELWFDGRGQYLLEQGLKPIRKTTIEYINNLFKII